MKIATRVSILTLTLTLLSMVVTSDSTFGDEPTAEEKTAVASPPKTEPAQATKVGDITLLIPTTWKPQPPTNRLRLAQFEIPAIGDDNEAAELSVFNFGAGGTVEQQVDRWKGQFMPENRKFAMEQGQVELGDYVFVKLGGIYRKPNGPPVLGKTVPMPGASMLVAMIRTEEGTYFLKLVGLEATVSAATADFRKSFGAQEKPPATAE